MKKHTRRIIEILLAIVMVMALTVTSFAQDPTLSESQAIDKALEQAKLARSQIKCLDAEYDREDNTYEIEFVRKSNKAKYEYEISASDGRVFEKSVDYSCKPTKSKKKIGKKAARQKAAKFSGISYKVISKGTCTYSYKHHKGKYTIKFKSGNYRYEYEISAPNGKILEYEWEMIKR